MESTTPSPSSSAGSSTAGASAGLGPHAGSKKLTSKSKLMIGVKGGKLSFKSDRMRHAESFVIADAGTGTILYSVNES